MDAAAIKVRIGLRPNGHADHPDWSSLPLAGSGTKDEREQAVRAHQAHSWVYDKTSGHAEETPGSPRGVQFGMMLVSERFAAEAMAAFPALVTRMTEAEAREFWDVNGHGHLEDERRDDVALKGLKDEFVLIKEMLVEFPGNVKLLTRKTALVARIQKALDPDDAHPGVRKDRMRRWATAKPALGVTFKEPA